MARRPSARNQSNESFLRSASIVFVCRNYSRGVANETESFPKGRTHIV
jgi:hypothetical protein